eukprot:6192038-Pleurochrysis_carterae.AAC.2
MFGCSIQDGAATFITDLEVKIFILLGGQRYMLFFHGHFCASLIMPNDATRQISRTYLPEYKVICSFAGSVVPRWRATGPYVESCFQYYDHFRTSTMGNDKKNGVPLSTHNESRSGRPRLAKHTGATSGLGGIVQGDREWLVDKRPKKNPDT